MSQGVDHHNAIDNAGQTAQAAPNQDLGLINPKNLLWILIIACLSFIPTLFLPHLGEEGVYTSSSLEMLYTHNYATPFILGQLYTRPPLYNWLILLVAAITSPHYILLAARIVAATTTLLSCAGIFTLMQRITNNNRNLALFAAITYLNGDLLLRRGWIAYSDPLFASLIFFSLLWLLVYLDTAITKHSVKFRYLGYSAICISLAFLAKVHTAYIFYFSALFVIFCLHPKRKLLLNWRACCWYVAILAVPILWPKLITSATQGDAQINDLYEQILLNLRGFSLAAYGLKLVSYPLKVAGLFLPVSGIAIYLLCRKNWRATIASYQQHYQQHLYLLIFAGIAAINLLPYWLVPQTPPTRYLLPIYPFVAMACSMLVWSAGPKFTKLTLQLCIAVIILKYVLSFTWFPYEYNVRRGNVSKVAHEIIAISKDYPVFINDLAAKGVNLAATISTLTYPHHAPVTSLIPWRRVRAGGVTEYNQQFADPNFSGFVVVRDSAELPKLLQSPNGKALPYKVVAKYILELNGELFLACFNRACREQ
jgi:4-amino-4-deoxy-L-arabinose transferase-like glycosyltransferase